MEIKAAQVKELRDMSGVAMMECKKALVDCDGDILHNDHWLDDDQKAGQSHIMPCVSRFAGNSLVLDR